MASVDCCEKGTTTIKWHGRTPGPPDITKDEGPGYYLRKGGMWGHEGSIVGVVVACPWCGTKIQDYPEKLVEMWVGLRAAAERVKDLNHIPGNGYMLGERPPASVLGRKDVHECALKYLVAAGQAEAALKLARERMKVLDHMRCMITNPDQE